MTLAEIAVIVAYLGGVDAANSDYDIPVDYDNISNLDSIGRKERAKIESAISLLIAGDKIDYDEVTDFVRLSENIAAGFVEPVFRERFYEAIGQGWLELESLESSAYLFANAVLFQQRNIFEAWENGELLQPSDLIAEYGANYFRDSAEFWNEYRDLFDTP